jgi:hypothetical protein
MLGISRIPACAGVPRGPASNPPTFPAAIPHPIALARVLALLALGILSGLSLRGQPADSPVRAELVVPPAEIRVIGDPTPLIWRFENRSAEPLAFMWEGCCRLNGRLTVTAAGQRVAPVPPGQALAHMFAKAERLEPGRAADFETRLSDWVQLHETGAYQLEGHYTGVLPEQQPQVPRGLKLWRSAASTPPIRVALLSIPDYLAQRAERSSRRQLQLTLSGPNRLQPLQPGSLRLTLANTGDAAQRIIWPHHLQLWVVDAHQQRLGNVATSLEGAYEELTIPARSQIQRDVAFEADRFAGLPFGTYTLFLDLQPGPSERPRVPSNPIAVLWELDPSEVAALLLTAARGPRVGLRNAPLKFLRVYVAEVAPLLAVLDLKDAPTNAVVLRDQLVLAGCLKPFAPKPGRVDLAADVPAQGNLIWRGGLMSACADHWPSRAKDNPVAALEALLAVRRHLGWELTVSVEPAPAATVGHVMTALQPFEPLLNDLAEPPRALLPDGTTNSPGQLVFRRQPIPAGLVFQFRKGDGVVRAELARSLAAPSSSLPQNLLKPADLAAVTFENVPDPVALARHLEAPSPLPPLLVLADRTLPWSELLRWLEPLRTRRLSAELCLAESPGSSGQ